MRDMSVSCDPCIRYTFSNRSTKVDKSIRWTRWTVSASTLTEIETIEIPRKDKRGKKGIREDYMCVQKLAWVRFHIPWSIVPRCSLHIDFNAEMRSSVGISVVWLYGMVTKLVCSIFKASKISNDSLPPIIFAEVRVVILNYVSPCCFQTSFIRLPCVFYLRTSKRVSLGELIYHGF